MSATVTRRKASTKVKNSAKTLQDKLPSFLTESDPSGTTVALPPRREHVAAYHRPILSNKESYDALLAWFETVSTSRSMPWRKSWINPRDFEGKESEYRSIIAKRAYEVWVSETMLQQTRVATVIPYFNTWMSKWPTLEALSAASVDDVLSVWSGLGYYSRATRLHEAAQAVVSDADMQGLLPSTPEDLKDKVKGVGPYTAGAISSIVFGRAVPLVDGNVSRVLCRQLGLFANVADKATTDLLWIVAGLLVKAASGHASELKTSDVPGKWNQALMELGSTICTPKPQCQICPVQKSCKTFSEGKALAISMKLMRDEKGSLPAAVATDIEDLCTLCDSFEDEIPSLEIESTDSPDPGDDAQVTATSRTRATKRKTTATTEPSQASKRLMQSFVVTVDSGNVKRSSTKTDTQISQYFSAKGSVKKEVQIKSEIPAKALEVIQAHCARFPKKVIKKKVPEEECVVCIIQKRNNPNEEAEWLIEQRPDKGLLASLWEYPTSRLPTSNDSSASKRKSIGRDHAAKILDITSKSANLKHEGELGTVTHVFSHLKLYMHAHLFILDDEDDHSSSIVDGKMPRRKWVTLDTMKATSMGTGMRKCFALAEQHGS